MLVPKESRDVGQKFKDNRANIFRNKNIQKQTYANRNYTYIYHTCQEFLLPFASPLSSSLRFMPWLLPTLDLPTGELPEVNLVKLRTTWGIIGYLTRVMNHHQPKSSWYFLYKGNHLKIKLP